MSVIKNKHWFPHLANLRYDRRMKRAMHDLPGGVGYGAIVLIIEHLRCEPKYKYPMADLDLLADEFNISLPIMQTIINKYGFFEIIVNNNEEVFFSPLLNELMIPYDEKREKNKIAGKISAKQRKLKQEEQVYLLSQLDSTQQMLNICSTSFEQNRKEQNTKEHNIKNLSIPDFQIFKKLIIKNFKNKIVCTSPDGFNQHVTISLSSLGYLHNEYANKDLEPNDAKKVWEWMFNNQSCIQGENK